MNKQNQLLAASIIILLATLTLVEGANLRQKTGVQKPITTVEPVVSGKTVTSTSTAFPKVKAGGKDFYVMRTLSGSDGYKLIQYCGDKPLQLTDSDGKPYYEDKPICLWGGSILELQNPQGVQMGQWDVYATPGLHDWYLIYDFSFVERNGKRYILIKNEVNNYDEILEAGDNRSFGVSVTTLDGWRLNVPGISYGYEYPIDPAIKKKGYGVYENASCSGGPGCSGTVTVVDFVTGVSAETKEVFDFQNHEGLELKSVKLDEKTDNFILTATEGSTTKDIVLTLKPKPNRQ